LRTFSHLFVPGVSEPFLSASPSYNPRKNAISRIFRANGCMRGVHHAIEGIIRRDLAQCDVNDGEGHEDEADGSVNVEERGVHARKVVGPDDGVFIYEENAHKEDAEKE
jgi:hypothetical protein